MTQIVKCRISQERGSIFTPNFVWHIDPHKRQNQKKILLGLYLTMLTLFYSILVDQSSAFTDEETLHCRFLNIQTNKIPDISSSFPDPNRCLSIPISHVGGCNIRACCAVLWHSKAKSEDAKIRIKCLLSLFFPTQASKFYTRKNQ